PAVVETVRDEEQGSGAAPEIGQLELDAAAPPDLQAGRLLDAAGDQPDPAQPRPRHRGADDHDARDGEHGELVGAEQSAADEEPGGRAGERPAPPREQRRTLGAVRRVVAGAHPVAPGTLTSASTSRNTSATVRPRSSASGVTRSRCSSTAGARALTSSGRT